MMQVIYLLGAVLLFHACNCVHVGHQAISYDDFLADLQYLYNIKEVDEVPQNNYYPDENYGYDVFRRLTEQNRTET